MAVMEAIHPVPSNLAIKRNFMLLSVELVKNLSKKIEQQKEVVVVAEKEVLHTILLFIPVQEVEAPQLFTSKAILTKIES